MITDPRQIAHAAAILKKGGVIAYPTDTVYGLGADASNEQAVARIYRIKRRSPDQPFPLLMADREELSLFVDRVPEAAILLMDRFWPGGLTIVFPKKSGAPRWLTAGGEGIALRVPDHPVTLALLRAFGKPIIGTSANRSGLPSPLTAEAVQVELGSDVDFILDGGTCPGGIASTVVDVTGQVPVVLREGAISPEDIGKIGCLGNIAD